MLGIIAIAGLNSLIVGCGSSGPSPSIVDDVLVQGDIGPVEDAGPATLENECVEDAECLAGKGCSSGVCVALADGAAPSVITDPVDDVPTEESPNLSCVGQPNSTPAGPATATLYGAVTRFGSGLKTYDIRVQVFDATTFDPSECADVKEGAEQEECYEAYGTPIGEALSQKVQLTQELPESCAGHSECPIGYRCIKNDLGNECLEQYGVFEIEGIPSNTPLVLRSTATKSKSKWHTTYSFNVFVFADQIDDEGRYRFDATMVSHGQWLLTPNTVGLGDVPPERGVLGGRIRDCRTDERDSWAIGSVKLGLASPPKKFVFFNELEDDTVPLDDRTETNILGRFAALDVEPGWNILSGYASIDSASVELGALPVYVFPNSLTVVSWPGRQPYWSQK